MKVLIACEESQAVCKEMRRLGHEAYSCDIQEPSGGHPEWHILGDAVQALRGGIITTMDGVTHNVGKWDMLVAHPPCTYLSNAGACRLVKKIGGKRFYDAERLEEGLEAKEFFMKFWTADIPRVVVENPVPSKIYRLPPYTQIIQPYEYGDPYSKRTCLWTRGVPLLVPSKVVEPICSWVSGGSKDAHGNKRSNVGAPFRSAKKRSKTFPGIARAIAEQLAGEA